MKLPNSCYYCSASQFEKSEVKDKFPALKRNVYNLGIIGKNYDSKGIMFILNRSDSRALNGIASGEGLFAKIHSEDSYVRALRLSDTGRLLGWLTQYCGISTDDVYITNAFKCLMPDDKDPKLKDYMICVDILKKQVLDAKPKKIIVYGSKAAMVLLPERTQLDVSTGISMIYETPTMFMYHPRRLHDMKIQERQKYFIEIRNFLNE